MFDLLEPPLLDRLAYRTNIDATMTVSAELGFGDPAAPPGWEL